jgi:GT2 family glycosyltransferase
MSAQITPGAAGQNLVRLAVVMPVFGNWPDTLCCLRLLARQTCREFRVYLADDGSPQPPPATVHDFSFVKYLRRQHTGFATTCNAAVKAAADDGCTHALLLNNDTSFGPEFIAAWRAKAAAFPLAIMGPIIHYFDRPDTIWYSGGGRSIAVPFFRLRRRYTTQTAVDVLTACVLLVPVDFWARLGGFDDLYVTYYEDFDFMLRAQELGVPAYVVVEPALRVLHKVSRTALRHGRWNREYRMIASRLIFIRRRYSGLERAACLCLAVPHLAFTLIMNLPELPNPRLLWNAARTGLKADTGDTGGGLARLSSPAE